MRTASSRAHTSSTPSCASSPPTLSDREFTDEACGNERLKAAKQGNVATLQATQDTGAITALMVACRAKQLAAVEVLVPTATIDAQSAKGCTALYLAAEEGDERIVRLLLQRRANVALAASDGARRSCVRACLVMIHAFGH